MSKSNIRCLLVHNSYQFEGGEDSVLQEEKSLLSAYGHDVKLFKVDNQEIKGLFKKLETGLNLTYSLKSKQRLSEKISQFQPDIVHIHNFFPLLTPSIYDACIEAKVPVIQTLHNFRLICPGALLLCRKKVCERCLTGSPYNAVIHKCYRNSRIESFAVARMVAFHRKNNTWTNKVTRFIALSNFSKSKFVTAGFPSAKIIVKPNFIGQHKETHLLEQADDNQENEINSYALFAGRLSEEKGINVLFDAWENININLRVVGDNMLQESITTSNKRIKFLGKLSKAEVQIQMQNAKFLVVPSICYETFGMVIIEAFSNGVPVIASNLGTMSEIIEHGKTGLLFEPGNSNELVKKIESLLEKAQLYKQMRINARNVYLEKYTSELNYKLLINIYEEALGDGKLQAE